MKKEIGDGINRIRLEFKVRRVKKIYAGLGGINRIRLEFKGERNAGWRLDYFVLIESDWNLKIVKQFFKKY